MLGRVTLFHVEDVNTAHSAATRAAIESVVFAPTSVLPGRGVDWRAESETVIVAGFDLPPEHPEVRVRIDDHGAIRAVSALRWGNAGEKAFQYIPFGGVMHAEAASAIMPSRPARLVPRDTRRLPPTSARHTNAQPITPPAPP